MLYLYTRNVAEYYICMMIRKIIDQDLLYVEMHDMDSERLGFLTLKMKKIDEPLILSIIQEKQKMKNRRKRCTWF